MGQLPCCCTQRVKEEVVDSGQSVSLLWAICEAVGNLCCLRVAVLWRCIRCRVSTTVLHLRMWGTALQHIYATNRQTELMSVSGADSAPCPQL
jgi:hypothetical protein